MNNLSSAKITLTSKNAYNAPPIQSTPPPIPNFHPLTLGEQIKQRRLSLKYSQRELGNLAQCSQTTIFRIENNWTQNIRAYESAIKALNGTLSINFKS